MWNCFHPSASQSRNCPSQRMFRRGASWRYTQRMPETTPITIRDARQRDLDSIAELDAMAYDASFPERPPAGREWRRYRRLALRDELRHDPF